jgi:hypothetical protein
MCGRVLARQFLELFAYNQVQYAMEEAISEHRPFSYRSYY